MIFHGREIEVYFQFYSEWFLKRYVYIIHYQVEEGGRAVLKFKFKAFYLTIFLIVSPVFFLCILLENVAIPRSLSFSTPIEFNL